MLNVNSGVYAQALLVSRGALELGDRITLAATNSAWIDVLELPS